MMVPSCLHSLPTAHSLHKWTVKRWINILPEIIKGFIVTGESAANVLWQLIPIGPTRERSKLGRSAGCMEIALARNTLETDLRDIERKIV